MSVPPAIVGCVTIAAPPEHAEALEALILNDVHFSVEATPGLLAHEVYRVGGQVGRLLVIHGWRSLEALESFRAGARTSYAPRLRELNVSAERLTGIVAVQLSRFEE
jgi:quinol monooxygenase YgiN